MILYHGSPKTVEVPQYGFGSKENDYGESKDGVLLFRMW